MDNNVKAIPMVNDLRWNNSEAEWAEDFEIEQQYQELTFIIALEEEEWECLLNMEPWFEDSDDDFLA